MLAGLLIIAAGATVLSVFPVQDRNSTFGMLVIRSRWLLLIFGGGIVGLFAIAFILLQIFN